MEGQQSSTPRSSQLSIRATPPPMFGEFPNLGGRQGPSSFMEVYHKGQGFAFPPTSILGTRPTLDRLDTHNEDSASGRVILKKHLEEDLVLPGAAAPRHQTATGQQRAACFWIPVPKPRMGTTCLLSRPLQPSCGCGELPSLFTRLSSAEPLPAACKPASTPTC